MKIPNFADIRAAKARISSFVNSTPLLTNKTINELSGAEIHFKCENFQKVGAFKFRGACNSVFALDDESASKGVATHSSGNHAQALALAAKMRGIPATIVMPNNSPQVKKDAVAGYGAEIVFCEPTLEARESTLDKVISEKGHTFIHPYDNYNVICGQGTAAMEILEEAHDFDAVIAPVGGGGLLSGTAIATKSINPSIKVYAAEPEGADDAYRSFKAGEIIPSVKPNTICDGLLTSLGKLNFEIISKNVDEIFTANDDEIKHAMRLVWERMKIIIEPSSAVPLAIVLKNKELFAGQKIAIIISGGNVDLGKLVF
jgi:threonine dehydratase